VCRRSVIESDPFKQALTLNGQDVASLYLKVLEQLGDGGYMRYRTVPVFPQVGDKINRAIESIATKQMSATAALKQAQQQAIEAIKMGGYKIDL
jgi:multiple sugar transport system substrate-binding protein